MMRLRKASLGISLCAVAVAACDVSRPTIPRSSAAEQLISADGTAEGIRAKYFVARPSADPVFADGDLHSATIGAPADNFNIFPFGGAVDGSLGTRYQQAYDAGEFNAPGPLIITAIRFHDGAGELQSNIYRFILSTTPTEIDALSTSLLDLNRGPDATLFAAFSMAGPAPSTLTINGDVPYLYDPLDGNLVLEIGMSPGGVGLPANRANYAARAGTATGMFSRYHDFGTSSQGWGLVTTFDYALATPANLLALVADGLQKGTLTANRSYGAWQHQLALASKHAQRGSGNPCVHIRHALKQMTTASSASNPLSGPAWGVVRSILLAVQEQSGCT